MNIDELLKYTVSQGASDLHITVGIPPTMRVNGELVHIGENRLMPDDTEIIVKQILSDAQFEFFKQKGEIDLSFSLAGIGRFRVNVFRQRGTAAAAIRLVASRIPDPEELGLPISVTELAKKNRGLILVTGPTGSGKSTTLASLINMINQQRGDHILTLEDPIEYLHRHNKSIVNQREIGHDSQSYANALRAALRQDPDVILVGEMRDLETISIAITAAETGHLVLSTLHTIGAAKTIDRVIDIFPPFQQQQIRVQMSTVLQAVISQQLIPKKDKQGRVAAIEVMIANPAIRNLIREGKSHQITSIIQTGMKYGMQTMDHSLADLYKKGVISREEAVMYAVDQDVLSRMLM
ncbi:type IV pilus twitching motility protein PilT [Petroclostridium sp. X23]|uniref:type IV pilus twitching motility protein PilT n=1 Tax=Petroclostridium sp. X23 TaxID=3045146 RepID=UPI0024ADA301|nr:type IV pilus twitching motility protein PilT [Petroclostridium sp. X23]WHH59667.1 type IV pilus twitching motility protein PilT [Petroclostridium sp. X23]